jgi:hypothetical protein
MKLRYPEELLSDRVKELEAKLAEATYIIEDTLDCLMMRPEGGYLGQEASLIWQCNEFLGKSDD